MYRRTKERERKIKNEKQIMKSMKIVKCVFFEIKLLGGEERKKMISLELCAAEREEKKEKTIFFSFSFSRLVGLQDSQAAAAIP